MVLKGISEFLTEAWFEDFQTWDHIDQEKLMRFADYWVLEGFTPKEAVLRAYMRIKGFVPSQEQK